MSNSFIPTSRQVLNCLHHASSFASHPLFVTRSHVRNSFREEAGRISYVTPTSYLELLNAFTTLLGLKRAEVSCMLAVAVDPAAVIACTCAMCVCMVRFLGFAFFHPACANSSRQVPLNHLHAYPSLHADRRTCTQHFFVHHTPSRMHTKKSMDTPCHACTQKN